MQSSTKKNLIIAACYAGTAFFGMLIGGKFQKENLRAIKGSSMSFSIASGEKVDRILDIIEENYVDAVKADTLENLAINQILKKLDPHSSYLPPVEAKRFSESLDGNFNGIGVEYQMLNDTAVVTSVISGGPAEKAGMKSGDCLIKVANQVIAGRKITPVQIASLIGGKKGSDVKIEIKRAGLVKTLAVQRDKITISSIDISYAIDERTGYVKISKFGGRTDEDFISALQNLKKKGIKDLILDLRGNGGGYLNSATALADQFLPDKKLIVYTKGEHEPRTDYYATAEGEFEEGKLVVLIDENSASASEIVAGAIQDLDRGIVIGRRSFGKGLVQEQFNFGDGSALNLTVARYYTPSGRSIQKPYKAGAEKYYGEVNNRLKSGELYGKKNDSIYDKHKIFKTASGRAIYEGGGIMPDEYVPIDTSSYNEFYFQLDVKGVLDMFLYHDFVREFNPPASPADLIGRFSLSEEQYQKLVRVARSKGITGTASEVEIARKAVSAQLEKMLAKFYFGNTGYYQVQNLKDPVIARSLKILKRP